MNSVTCHLALYDAENQVAGTTSYWHWCPAEIPLQEMDRFYREVAKHCRPRQLADARNGQVFGGVGTLDCGWTVVFRYGDGGRNSQGRPGRIVIAAALVRTSETTGADLSDLLRHPRVEELLENSFQSCPTPKPDSLDFEIEAASIRADPVLLSEAVRDGHLLLHDEDGLHAACRVYPFLPQGPSWVLRIGMNDGFTKIAEITTVEKIAPEPEISTDSRADAPQPEGTASGTRIQKPRIINRIIRRFRSAPIWLPVLLVSALLVLSAVLAWPEIFRHDDPAARPSQGMTKIPVGTNGPSLNTQGTEVKGGEEKPPQTTAKSLEQRFKESIDVWKGRLKWFGLGLGFGLVTGLAVMWFWNRRRNRMLGSPPKLPPPLRR